ncbi:hypothetical protein BCL90_4359 [Pedobacter alluvionis]|uniref:Uncharacterized protein n=1 Tax=Pedobacter alluvionis TaxID=475253 RepID=A0A497XWA2_9SPHI|nr:hypothetical protein BCL90_4359 [Pedobacter alluvionis]
MTNAVEGLEQKAGTNFKKASVIAFQIQRTILRLKHGRIIVATMIICKFVISSGVQRSREI